MRETEGGPGPHGRSCYSSPAPVTAIGAWAEAAPHQFFRSFPWGHWHWLTLLGPYNEHIVPDVGGVRHSASICG